jgi:hypothetical protein
LHGSLESTVIGWDIRNDRGRNNFRYQNESRGILKPNFSNHSNEVSYRARYTLTLKEVICAQMNEGYIWRVRGQPLGQVIVNLISPPPPVTLVVLIESYPFQLDRGAIPKTKTNSSTGAYQINFASSPLESLPQRVSIPEWPSPPRCRPERAGRTALAHLLTCKDESCLVLAVGHTP